MAHPGVTDSAGLGTRAQHTHGHGQCPSPAHSLHTRLGSPDPRHHQESQALASPCARAPVTHPAHGNTCWRGPASNQDIRRCSLPQASLLQLQGPGQAQSKLPVFAGVPALQPSQGSEQKTGMPRAGGAQGKAGWYSSFSWALLPSPP